MNEEIKASVDSPEFSRLIGELFEADDLGVDQYDAARANLIAHINAWGEQLAASRAVLPVTDNQHPLMQFLMRAIGTVALKDFAEAEKLGAEARAIIAATPVAGWVSVEVRLPTREGFYPVLISDPYDIGWSTAVWWRAEFRNGEWCGCDPIEDGQPVTHWSELAPVVTPTQQEQS